MRSALPRSRARRRGRAVFGDVRRDVPLDGRDGSDEPVSSHRPPRFPLPPAAQRLLPNASRDSETLAAISANLSADLLGLGNAATPLGIRAACRMSRGCKGTASDELCLLVVLNTASIQLLPTTLAGVRASLGAADPFDILPAVWLTSLLSVLAGLLAAKLFARLWRN